MNNEQIATLLTAAIGNLGFPIVITIYLLVRFEKKIEKLSSGINELIQVIKEEVRK